MADPQAPIIVEINEEERVLLAALKAVQDKKARILEEAEEKRRADEAAKAKWKAEEAAEEKRKAEEAAEEKRKAEEAAEEKRKANEAEAQKLEAAEKEKAAQAQAEKEEAKRIQAANTALEAGIVAHEANKQKMAEESAAARAKAQALATHQKKLAKLGVTPDDPLMQAPEGPGPSRQEVREVQRELSGKLKKRKVRETEITVCLTTFRPRTY
jgi:hypothetical protein